MSLWPRQEVLQLVLQQLSHSAKGSLTNSNIAEAIQQFAKVQTPEGTVTFDRWLVVAKNCLKWTDPCIKL